MANKQIVDLDPLVGGMDDTYNFWTQVDGGGAGSSFQMAWSKLFLAKDAAAASDADGTSIVIAAGAGDGDGAGGNLDLRPGLGYDGGNLRLYGGEAATYEGGEISAFAGYSAGQYGVGGNLRLYAGVGTYGGDVKIKGGVAASYNGDIRLIQTGLLVITNYDTSEPATTGSVWVDTAAGNVLKLKTA